MTIPDDQGLLEINTALTESINRAARLVEQEDKVLDSKPYNYSYDAFGDLYFTINIPGDPDNMVHAAHRLMATAYRLMDMAAERLEK